VRTTIMLALPLLAGLALSTAAEPPAKDRSAAVAKWIEQLGDSDPQKRDEALEKLEAEGAAALPALRQGLTHPDPEVRRRLRDLVPELEARIILAPKRVTLKMTGTIPDVLKEITKQTGYKVESWGGAPPQQQAHTFDFAAVPFWEAIDRIGQQTGLVVQTGYGDNRVVLQPQDAINPYVWHEGPFRFVANSVQQNRQIDLTLRPRNGPPPVARNESMTFSFTVFVEPKLPILGVGEARLAAAYDNERNSLVPPTPPADERPLQQPWPERPDPGAAAARLREGIDHQADQGLGAGQPAGRAEAGPRDRQAAERQGAEDEGGYHPDRHRGRAADADPAVPGVAEPQ
jgi:hypothetical protein